MLYLGDYRTGRTVTFPWNTNAGDGASITRATNGTLRVYKNDSSTERSSAAGITETEDFDSVTGVHMVKIDLSDNTDAGFYAAGNDYWVCYVGMTIDGKTVNHALCQFSIENRSPLMPTVAGRTLGVAAGGQAGVDLDNAVGTLEKTTHITGFNDLSAASVNAEVDTALADIRLDELLAADSDIDGAAPPTVGSVFFELLTASTGAFTFTQTTDSLEAIANDLATRASATQATNIQTDVDDIQARLPATLSSGRMRSDAEAISGSTAAADAVEANIAFLDASVASRATPAQVATEAAAALVAIHLDHLLAVDYDPASKPGVATALLNELVESDGGVSRYTANALEQAPSGGGGTDWTAGEREQIRDALGIDGTKTAATGGDLQNVQTKVDTLHDSRLTSSRAGYLDFLNVGGNVSTSAEVTAIRNNTRVVRVVPEVIERPDSGTQTYRVELFLYDSVGNMEAPDSAPTIALVNQAGTDRSSRLDSTTMALVETGYYRAIYTASAGDALEQLLFTFSVVEGGATRKYGNQSLIVDTTAVDFTAADRTKLDTLHDTRIPGVVQPQTGDAFGRLATYRLGELLSASLSAPAAGSLFGELTEDDGGLQRFTINALEQAPAGGGGGGSTTVILGAIQTTTQPGNRINSPIKLEMFQSEGKTFPLTVLDSAGAPVNLAAMPLRFVVEDSSVPPVAKFKCEGSDITLSGASNEIANVKVTAAKAANASLDWHWRLLHIPGAGDPAVLLHGPFIIHPSLVNAP